MNDLKLLLTHIERTLGARIWMAAEDEDYPSVPLCVIDAVYSIGVRYESTQRTVNTFLSWSRWSDDREHQIGDFLDLLRPYEGRWEALASQVFQNRQRTSSRSGILKAEAVYRFAEVLQRFGVQKLADVEKINPNYGVGPEIAVIRGQSSGISFKYFLMLAGFQSFVKPDRMITRFVAAALKLPSVHPEHAEQLVRSAAESLKSTSPKITASLLDYRIWQYQRTIQPKVATRQPGEPSLRCCRGRRRAIPRTIC
jgi:hypothetical protein